MRRRAHDAWPGAEAEEKVGERTPTPAHGSDHERSLVPVAEQCRGADALARDEHAAPRYRRPDVARCHLSPLPAMTLLHELSHAAQDGTLLSARRASR